MPNVKVIPQKLKRKKATRVAAYTRVSSPKAEMIASLSAQVDYYNNLITANPDWELCGIYVDEAKTGTKDTRENFRRLIDDCRQGLIDLVITKSVSRFARNTVDLLSVCRELREHCVDVYFENQDIHSVSSEGELMLTLLASIAQEQSRSDSENQKWRIRKNFEEGNLRTIFCTSTLIEGVNLPADNLFITDNKIFRSEMEPVDFRNLIGRVGRISFNLYGNVYFVSDEAETVKS